VCPILASYNNKTNWDSFRLLFAENVSLNISLKTTADIEAAVNNFSNLIQWAGWSSTLETSNVLEVINRPFVIKQKLLDKRRLRRTWLRFHSPATKRLLNKACRNLKQLISEHNKSYFQYYTQNLSPTAATDYSLWKAFKTIKHIPLPSPQIRTPQGTSARTNIDKVHIFATYLSCVFHPHPTNISPEDENSLVRPLESPYQIEPPTIRNPNSHQQP
jgi:hypothetical protein